MSRFVILDGNTRTVRDTVERNNIHLGFPEEAVSVCAMLNVLESTSGLTEKLTEQTTIIYHQAQRLLELTELLEIEEEKNSKLTAKIKAHVSLAPLPLSKVTPIYTAKSGAPTWQN